jgi:membrane protein DedA with SNARE-associated domain
MELATAVQQYGYPVVFVGSVLEGETVLTLAGLAAHRGYLSLQWVIAIAALGGFLGDQLYFALGRRYGARLLDRYPRLALPMSRATSILERHNAWLIIAMRFMYGLRTAGPLAVGMSRIGWLQFAALNALGAVLWAPLFVGAGYLLGDVLERLLGDLKAIEHWLFAGLVVVGVALWLAGRRRERFTQSRTR